MVYKKFILLLKGRSRGTLTLEIGEKLKYSFSCPFTPEDADILLFNDESTFIRLPGTEGVASLKNADKVRAAALVKGQLFLMMGERQPFNWRRAQTSFALKNAPITSARVANISEEPTRRTQSTAANVAPSVKELKTAEGYAPAVIISKPKEETAVFAEPATDNNTLFAETKLAVSALQTTRVADDMCKALDTEPERWEREDIRSVQEPAENVVALDSIESAKPQETSAASVMEPAATVERPVIFSFSESMRKPDISIVKEEKECSMLNTPVESAGISPSSVEPTEPEELPITPKEFVELGEEKLAFSLFNAVTYPPEEPVDMENTGDVQTEFLQKKSEQTIEEERQDTERTQKAPERKSCIQAEEQVVSPFSHVFGESVWHRVEYPYLKGHKFYLIGEIFNKGDLSATVLAVPGEYALNPPPWLQGFNLYLNSDDGIEGYWVYMRDATTGNPTTIRNILSRS
jgi:hypothetical protein